MGICKNIKQDIKNTRSHVQIKMILTTNDIEKSYIDDLLQDCSISSALAMEILQSCTKPSI